VRKKNSVADGEGWQLAYVRAKREALSALAEERLILFVDRGARSADAPGRSARVVHEASWWLRLAPRRTGMSVEN
jgi:hypothetical protein